MDNVYVSTDEGKTWENTVSRDYNYFERKNGGGFGNKPVDLRISCFNRKEVYMRDVNIKNKAKIWAEANC